ncbi:MAG TPA: XdhC family protein [Hyphomicrobiaceae bacterium]|nr:XdhC family protein [Hyphomicrobiaceae bacterium]
MSEPGHAPDAKAEIDVLKAAATWLKRDGKVALATVIDTWGSAPVPVGGQMAIAADGRFQGSVSGGCIEGEVIVEAGEILSGGKPTTMKFGVADETAWRVGLPCGGEVAVYLERIEGERGAGLIDTAISARETRRGLVVKTDLATGDKQLFERGGNLPDEIAGRFKSAKSGLVEEAGRQAFVQALVPPARLLIVGATHIAQLLCGIARIAGYDLIVVDPRTAFAAADRFEGVRLETEWPQDAIPKIGLDPYTAVIALSHVGHIDDEALKLALRSDCLYVGALGSKRNHAKRTERLTAAGFSKDEIALIHCPIGLDIGAQSPAEIAVSIMAEVVRAVRGTKRQTAAA